MYHCIKMKPFIGFSLNNNEIILMKIDAKEICILIVCNFERVSKGRSNLTKYLTEVL